MTTAHTAEHSSISAPRRDFGLVSLAAFVAVVLQYVYVFAFNYVPDSVRTACAGVLLTIHVALALLSLGHQLKTWQVLILLSITMMFGCLLVTHGINTDSTQFDTAEALRILSIYVMPLWLLAFPAAIPHRFVMVLAVGATVVGGTLALSGPPVYASGTPRLASITGGILQYHPSAKFIVAQLILVHQYYRARMLSSFIALPTILFALLILLGYGGRNEMVLVGAYFACLAYFRFRHVPGIRWFPSISLVLFAIVSVVGLRYGDDTHSWGSGRIGAWQYRLELIWSRDLATFLFGGGLGSDIIWTPQWSTLGDLPAHNDYLHTMMETGLLGLIAVLVFLAGLMIRLPGSSKSILIALLISSLFSNAYFQSPLLAMNYCMIMATALYYRQIRHWQGRTDLPRPPARKPK
jgi:hypothetical protein